MLRQFMRYTFAATALYVIVLHATDAGNLMVKGAQAYGTGVGALEGRK